MKPETWLETVNCAIEGILHAAKSQRHMRWHLLVGVAVVLLSLRLPLSSAEFGLLCLSVTSVLVAELLNSAVESVVDLASPQFHELARVSKDVAAGAVLVASLGAAAVGWVVLFPRMGAGATRALEAVNHREPAAVAGALLVVLVIVVLLKALAGKGTPLHGGFPSGHAAASFAMATLLTLRSRDLMVAALATIMALMVSHSRLLLRVHTWTEVLMGASLGAVTAALVYWLVF